MFLKSVGKSVGKMKATNISLIKIFAFLIFLFVFPLIISGCGVTGAKTSSLLIIYIITSVFSLILLLGYFITAKKKNLWYVLLYTSIFIVNIGYLSLSLSNNLAEALLANRISYLGSVFLPLSMFMIIMNVTNINFKRFLPYVLVGVSVAVFVIAASPGYSDVYYKEVSFVVENGISSLEKVYGPLHVTYLIYLLSYFGAMIGVIAYSVIKRKNTTHTYPIILAFSVFINIGLWLLEQFVKTEFEMLSVSYIITGMFLLGLNLMLRNEASKAFALPVVEDVKEETDNSGVDNVTEDNTPCEEPKIILDLNQLTKTERVIYDCYIDGKSTKEIMSELSITVNTLKYHNKNIYGKLGVTSRKQLIEIAKK